MYTQVACGQDFSSARKRQYLSDSMTREFVKKLTAYFRTTVKKLRIMRGERQEIETLINEEALLFAKYLRNERKEWKPRTALLVPLSYAVFV